MKYKDLVSKAKEYYSSETPIIGGVYTKKDKQTGKKEIDPFILKWCPECEEINLWTYQQGHKNKKAKILLFGQDWACPWSPVTGKLLEYIERILVDNKCSERYIAQIKDDSFPTDIMLKDLMISLGKEYDPFIPDNENLFFTNLCVGYRDHGASGGMYKKFLRHDVEYAEVLIEIVEPKIVICLGKDTYNALVKELKCVPKSKERSFYKKLAKGECYAMYQDRIPIFGQAHTGSLGIINRWRYNPEKLEYSEKIIKQLLLEDWAVMKDFQRIFWIKQAFLRDMSGSILIL